MTLPKSGGSEWAASQATPWATVNQSMRRLDATLNRWIVVDDDLTAPPGSCADGANYFIAATATGAWAGQDGKLATAVGANASNGWLFTTIAVEGYVIYLQDEDLEKRYNGSSWVTLNAGVAEASASEIRTGTATDKYISPSKMFAAAAPAALTSGTTITPDGNNGMNFTLTIAHTATLANPSNFKVGQSGVIEITQDGSGNHTLAYGSNWKFPGGAPVLSTAAGAIDLLAYFVVASGRILATLTKAYSS